MRSTIPSTRKGDFAMHALDKRLQQVRQRLEAENLDAMIVTQPENRRYLSGFTGTDGVLLISAREAMVITDFRFVEQATNEAPDFDVLKVSPDKLGRELNELARKLGAKRVAFESHHLTVSQHAEWSAAATDYKLVPIKELIEGMRAIKDDQELAAIKRAVALGDAAMAHIRELIRPGMTEKEVAWELESHMRIHGAEAVAFDIIVASGPNGAMAHATVSDRAIREGEPIIIDVGARVDGYHSDLSRTLCLGEPDHRFKEIYHLVLKAQVDALEGIRPGMTGREADALARDVIERAGYGKCFGHGLGHSVGLAVHENPRASRTSEEVLRPGMTLTVEPAIYISGWGGVRIEDLVVITEQSVEVLSQADKDPLTQ